MMKHFFPFLIITYQMGTGYVILFGYSYSCWGLGMEMPTCAALCMVTSKLDNIMDAWDQQAMTLTLHRQYAQYTVTTAPPPERLQM